MNELVPEHPVEQPVDLLQEHPHLVQDQAKAEIMAYASSGEEEAVVKARGLALEAASNIGSGDFRDDQQRGALEAATHQVALAEHARATADNQASQAAEIYDQVKGL